MSQIKDTARSLRTTPPRAHRQSGPRAIDGQISGLLTRRNALVEELAAVDRKLQELSAAAARRGEASDHARASRWLPLRGEELLPGGFVAPPGLDAEDLNRRLAKILIDERRQGRPVDGLELLVAFRPVGGRVLSVRTRRSGESDWVRRFEARGVGH